MSRNKYGGINDMPSGWCKNNKRVYSLWFGMLRRCYDKDQQKRTQGRSYADCSVCKEWFFLSNFCENIKTLNGYKQWASGENMVLDKDTIITGNKEYAPSKCCFLTSYESVHEMDLRHPDIMKEAHKASRTQYILTKGKTAVAFESEADACKFLGVRKCSVASCFRRGSKCKKYSIALMDGKDDSHE